MLLAGLDIGTTGCKITVFDEQGTEKCSRYEAYPAVRSADVHEIDAAGIWDAVQTVLGEAAAVCGKIESIGITSFGETFVLLDEKDAVLAPSMLYTDPRGKVQCGRLTDSLGARKIKRVTGLNPHHMYSLPKLMWIREQRPELYGKIRRVMLMEDYVVYQLTGVAQIDYSLAARTMAFDIHTLNWSEELFQAAGVEMKFFSKPVPTGTEAGKIRKEVCRRTGLSENTSIVSVSHDQVAAAVGSGVFEPGAAVDGAGTVQCNTPVFTDFDEAVMAAGNYCIVPYLQEGRYVTYAFSYTGGALLEWYMKKILSRSGEEAYMRMERGAGDQPTGLLVMPHFAGAATPYMDDGSRGAIVGLTLSHTEYDIYRGILEGVCYEIRINQELLQKAGIAWKHLYATGGGAKNRLWMQMKADVLNIPVTALQVNEAGAVGSAMLAGIRAGIFPDVEAAKKSMVKELEIFLPREAYHTQYEEIFGRYRGLYEALRPLI